jgi:hypothetical protein
MSPFDKFLAIALTSPKFTKTKKFVKLFPISEMKGFFLFEIIEFIFL